MNNQIYSNHLIKYIDNHYYRYINAIRNNSECVSMINLNNGNLTVRISVSDIDKKYKYSLMLVDSSAHMYFLKLQQSDLIKAANYLSCSKTEEGLIRKLTKICKFTMYLNTIKSYINFCNYFISDSNLYKFKIIDKNNVKIHRINSKGDNILLNISIPDFENKDILGDIDNSFRYIKETLRIINMF